MWKYLSSRHSPRDGDIIFYYKTYAAEEIGSQNGLSYTYLDEGLIDGMNYFYSVVSYDQGVPVADIPPLESSFISKYNYGSSTTYGFRIRRAAKNF